MVLGAAACVRPALVECGDLACAPDQVCHDDRCLDPSQLTSCAAPIGEGSACDVRGEAGHCTAGVCEAATCGDGYVDADLREVCDDSTPPVHCVDVGFDLGRPGCSATCQADPSIGCMRFGWERIVDEASTFMWTDGETLAYLTLSPAALEVHTPTTDTVVPGAFFGVFGASKRVVTWSSNAVRQVENGVVRALPLLAGSIGHVRMDDAGTIYALASCTISAIGLTDTAWTTLGTVTGPACGRLEVGPIVSGRARVLVTRGEPSANELWEYNPATKQFQLFYTLDAGISSMRIQPTATGDVVWATAGASLSVFRIDGTAMQAVSLGFAASTIAFAGSDIYFGDSVGTVARLRNGRLARFRSPTGGLIITGGDRLYAYRGSIHRFTGITRGSRSPITPSTPVEIVASLVEPDGTILAVSRAQIHTPNPEGNSWTHTSVPGISAHAFAGAAPTYFLSSFDDTLAPSLITSTSGIAGPWSEVAVPGTPKLLGLWRDRDGALFAVGDLPNGTAFLGVLRAGSWTTTSLSGCTARAVSGIDASHVVASGACGDEAVIWTYDGAQWTELARPPLSGSLDAVVRFSDTGIVAAGTSGATWFDGSSWHTDPGAVGQRLSGTSFSDVWLSGAFTTIQHFDGAVWSKLDTQASGPISVAASSDRVLFPGATADYVELVR